MKDFTPSISEQEELQLVSQSIDNLLAEGIENTREKILEIMSLYPSLKKERFSDEQFKQTVFDAMKKYFDVSTEFFAYHFGSNYNKVEEYNKQFPFLTDIILKNKELQMKLMEYTKYELKHLAESSKYGDNECTKYSNDRMSSLYMCERIWKAPFISEKVKDSQLPLLKEVIYHRLYSRHEGPRLKRVLDFGKSANISEYEIGQAMWDVRLSESGREIACDPKLLEYPEFPKKNLKTKEAQKKIRGMREKSISEGCIKNIISFVATYPFLNEKLKKIVEKIKTKKEEEQYDEETSRLIHFVTEGMKKRLGYLDSETAEKLKKHFSDIVTVVPRKDIVEGIYTGMNAMNGHTHDKEKDKKDLLNRFPLEKEEIMEFIQTKSMGHPDELIYNLRYFPDHDFSDIFKEPEVKEKLLARLMDETFPLRYIDSEKITFLKSILNTTQEELEDRYISHFITILKKEIENNNRSRGIKHKLKYLRNLCADKEKYKQRINTDEIRALLLAGAKMRIYDHGFSDSFGSDHKIHEICNHESFPLKPEELESKVIEVFLAHCRGGNIPYRQKDYACIKKYMGEKSSEFVEAGIQGILYLLNPKIYKSEYDVESRFMNISLLIRQLPFLKEIRKQDTKIQKALVTLKRHFLTQGWVVKVADIVALEEKCS